VHTRLASTIAIFLFCDLRKAFRIGDQHSRLLPGSEIALAEAAGLGSVLARENTPRVELVALGRAATPGGSILRWSQVQFAPRLRLAPRSELGGSAGQSVVLMAIVVGLTAVQSRYIERKVTN